MNTTTQPRADGQAAHTPTPWIIDDNGIVTPEDMAQSLNEDAGTPREWVAIGVNDEEGFAECIAYAHPTNAAFIVDACNSHARLTADVKRLSYALDQIGFMLAGTQFDGASKTILRVLRGEHLDDIRREAIRSASESSTNTEDR